MCERINTMNTIRSEIRLRYRNRLRECRLRGLIISEAELSRRTGIQRTTLSALENNRRFLPIEHALLIKEVLGCTLDELYEQVMPVNNRSSAKGKTVSTAFLNPSFISGQTSLTLSLGILLRNFFRVAIRSSLRIPTTFLCFTSVMVCTNS